MGSELLVERQLSLMGEKWTLEQLPGYKFWPCYELSGLHFFVYELELVFPLSRVVKVFPSSRESVTSKSM